MADPIVGAQIQVGMVAEVTAGTFVTPTELYEYIEGDLGFVETEFNATGMAGTRSQQSERTRANIGRVTGSLTFCPNALEWANLLPRILGAAASGTTFALAETLPAFSVGIDKDNGTDGKYFQYAGCYVNRATITSQSGGPVMLRLDIEGMTEAVASAGGFPSLSLGVATGPFLHADSSAAVVVGGTTYPARSVEITIDNALDTERFLNSTTRAALPALNRIITVNLGLPYGNATAAYPTAATLAAGVAVTVTWTNTVHAVSLLASFVKVHFPRRTPPLSGRNELDLPLSGIARRTAATRELVCTLDSTP